MKKVELFILPFTKENGVKTRLVVNGSTIDSKDNRLTNLVVCQPMWKWLNPYQKKLFVWGGLLEEIMDEFNDRSIHFIFHGCKADFTVFKRSILAQQAKLNRNSSAARISLELADTWDLSKAIRELSEMLEDLRVEADRWGEDRVIEEIDSVKRDIGKCSVNLKTAYHASPLAFRDLLLMERMDIAEDAVLTVIPVDGSLPLSGISDYIASSIKGSRPEGKCVVISTSLQQRDTLFDVVLSLDSAIASSVRYLELDGSEENEIREIETLWRLSILPRAIQKTDEILHMFPDLKTNNYLIDIAEKLEELVSIRLG